MSETGRPHPVGGMDYPRTLQEFDEWFASEAACIEYLQRIRWVDGFRCPHCGGTSAWPTVRGQFRCVQCQRQTSITAGTVFEGTRKPLRTWFLAMWYMTNQKPGVSALGLQRVLGLGYDHRPQKLSPGDDPAHVVMPRVHRVAALLDRWWLGTHQGAIRPKHLDYYLDEFTFRFNRRQSRARGLLFYRLLQQAVQVAAVPYRRLIGGKDGPPTCSG